MVCSEEQRALQRPRGHSSAGSPLGPKAPSHLELPKGAFCARVALGQASPRPALTCGSDVTR